MKRKPRLWETGGIVFESSGLHSSVYDNQRVDFDSISLLNIVDV